MVVELCFTVDFPNHVQCQVVKGNCSMAPEINFFQCLTTLLSEKADLSLLSEVARHHEVRDTVGSRAMWNVDQAQT